MKSACSLVMVSVMTITMCYGQHAKNMFVASVTGSDRISMAKNSIDVPPAHENSFWPIYENYMSKVENTSLNAFRAGHQLAHADANISNEEAFANARTLLDLRFEEIQIRKDYYRQIGAAMNGIVALQFLQTEAVMDIMESAEIYDHSSWKKYRFHPRALPENRVTEAKYNMISAALTLKPQDAQKFYALYSKYENERDAILGEDYDIFILYAGEPSDYTPALAKRLGYDMLSVLEREVKLKHKYFMEMAKEVGAITASRFLAWEDYHSAINKMYAMAEE